jgi:hypothetical protein
MKQLAIRLGYQKTITKSLVMMKQLVKQLAIPLMELLAIPLGNQNSVAKWLVISNQNSVAKWLVIAIRLGYQMALHSHSAKSPKYGDISRWLALHSHLTKLSKNDSKSLVNANQVAVIEDRWGTR